MIYLLLIYLLFYYSRPFMIIITGASQNHAHSLLQLIQSFLLFYTDKPSYTLIVYDLGFNSGTISAFHTMFSQHKNIIFETFDYSLCPAFFNINIAAGEYAWKPVIFYNEYTKRICYETWNETLIWMDAGNKILGPLDGLDTVIKSIGIYSEYSAGNLADWTHPDAIVALGVAGYMGEINKNTACFGVYRNYSPHIVDEFVKDFCFGAYRREMIAPIGSSRANHRQDQALFTCLFYKYKVKYGLANVNYYDDKTHTYGPMNYAIQQDCEAGSEAGGV